MSPQDQLHTLTSRILDADKYAYGELFAACDELHKTLLHLTGIDTEENSNREHLSLESGNAIGLTWAAMCIKDLMRTKRFMDGIYEAATAKLQANADTPVHILYAGTGPFATLILPLTARFSSRQVQFTLLEINENSYACLQQLIKTLQLENYIHRIEKADAAKWTLPANEQVDIFISETMQQGLKNEPQVAIYMNLIPQLQNTTLVIPEQITLKAVAGNAKKTGLENSEAGEPEHDVPEPETVFTLSREAILKHVTAYREANESPYVFPPVTVTLPQEAVANYTTLYLLTEITIYNREKLLTDESPLTMPVKLMDLHKQAAPELKFEYHTGKKPGMQLIT
jgi:predicted RNA methylase